LSRRRDNLPWSYHADVAALPREKQEEFLDSATTRRELRTAVARYNLGQKHAAIAGAAKASSISGQFALLYADNPWQFETYSDLGKELSPEQHYPTMSDEELCSLVVDGRPIQDVAAPDAGCFMWCTSSNIKRAIVVLEAWGFEYKTNLTWDKVRTGLGYIFLNQHEHLLYGKRPRCNFPMPVIKPASLISIERTERSRKPPEVRLLLESMYPHFTAANRIELFARGEVDGWTTWGNQAGSP
jgi:N6-adenosine-specific RNA methylase IME4